MEIYTNIVEYCIAKGIHLRKIGRLFRARCPLSSHNGEDIHPSFTIYPDTQSFYCFGCLEGGDAQYLARLLGYEPPVILNRGVKKYDQKYFDPSEEQVELMTRFCNIYNEYIPTPIREYLNNRGFSNEEIKKFKLGYCTGKKLHLRLRELKLTYLLGMTNLRGWELFDHRILIPEIRGKKVIWFQGRTIDDNHLKYLNVKLSTPLFGLESFANSKYVWIVEGTLDALALISEGEPATAIIGTSLQERHKEIFFGRIVKLCMDNDEAGKVAAQKIKNQLHGVSFITVDVKLPKEFKDLSEMKAKGELKKWLNTR